MARFGHPLHRGSLGVLLLWLGGLKIVGYETGSPLLAQAVYWLPAELALPALGWWEAAIGVGLLVPSLVRAAVLLIALRLPGTLLALVLHADVSFEQVPFAPTPVRQFLIKDFRLFSAAMVIGGGAHREGAAHDGGEAARGARGPGVSGDGRGATIPGAAGGRRQRPREERS